MPPYNYETFDEHVISGDSGAEMGRFPDNLHAGGRAPDGELTRLEGGPVRLSELWGRGGVVLEFGSYT